MKDFEILQNEIDEINSVISKRFQESTGSTDHVNRQVLKLGEEYGELCEAVLAEGGLQRADKLKAHDSANVAKELADVLVTAMTIARYMNLDVHQLISEKLEFIKLRLTETQDS